MLTAPELIVAELVEVLDEFEVTAELQGGILADRMMGGEEGAEAEPRHVDAPMSLETGNMLLERGRYAEARLADLKGRVALVTGGSRGIGRAIAVSLSDAGAAVAVNYLQQGEQAHQVVEAIRGRGGRSMAVGADVSQAAAVKGMLSAVEAAVGPVDILVNNAGIGLVRGIDELTEEDFDRTIAVNLKSVFLCTQAVLPGMRARRWGRIVNISSGAARGAGAVGPHYNASKAGLEGLTRGYAARLASEGITVNAVAPSLIETDMVRAGVASSPARIPLGRFGTPQECAQVVMMLVGNAYMTGQTVALSGGLSFI